jgi:hypothetical protein
MSLPTGRAPAHTLQMEAPSRPRNICTTGGDRVAAHLTASLMRARPQLHGYSRTRVYVPVQTHSPLWLLETTMVTV